MPPGAKVFCFFFSKKKCFLPSFFVGGIFPVIAVHRRQRAIGARVVCDKRHGSESHRMIRAAGGFFIRGVSGHMVRGSGLPASTRPMPPEAPL
jgi:hypothetical protein